MKWANQNYNKIQVSSPTCDKENNSFNHRTVIASIKFKVKFILLKCYDVDYRVRKFNKLSANCAEKNLNTIPGRRLAIFSQCRQYVFYCSAYPFIFKIRCSTNSLNAALNEPCSHNKRFYTQNDFRTDDISVKRENTALHVDASSPL